jgi:hypothetical protein
LHVIEEWETEEWETEEWETEAWETDTGAGADTGGIGACGTTTGALAAGCRTWPPQPPQKFAPSATWAPQFVQNMASPYSER